MTRVEGTSGPVATFDAIFSTAIARCAEFCAIARQGRDIETHYHTLNRHSGPDLGRLCTTRTDMARAAFTETRH